MNSIYHGRTPEANFPLVPRTTFGRAIVIGLGVGAIGGLGMTVTNKLEQLITNRPNSYVPASTIAYHLGLQGLREHHPIPLNHAHRFGMAIITAPIRAMMSYYGVIGPFASYLFSFVRIAADEAVEISAGTSTWPWIWPINQQVIDVLHKGAYSVIVGFLCDKYIRGVSWFS
ncbi:hypothetical protein EJ08DRAFT_690534 [Tothia fuscella]|uniref:Uncharacterized protein n=1 Tax=Tothia fuscella TaxID=1048955 RepID=A0A9P4NFY9_9PEZI|nr:hypothetical protein EJ08DRAFT_690534 [Tothia fuscella]